MRVHHRAARLACKIVRNCRSARLRFDDTLPNRTGQPIKARVSLIRAKLPETTDAAVPELRAAMEKSVREQVVANAVQVRALAATALDAQSQTSSAQPPVGTVPAAKTY